jgi:hypothetical protein
MPGTPQTLPVPPPVSIPTLLNAIRLAAGSGGSGGAAWGSITGTLANQTDLANALDAKLSLAGGTMTGLLTIGVGTNSPTPAAGLTLTNTTAATVGVQSASPEWLLTGQGWKTNATAGSQTVSWGQSVLPVQGAASPSAIWRLQGYVNGVAVANPQIQAQTNGPLIITGVSGVSENLIIRNPDGYMGNLAGFAVGGSGQMSICGTLQAWPSTAEGVRVTEYGNSSNFISLASVGTFQRIRSSSDIVNFANGANAQAVRIFGTYTDASNYVRLAFNTTSTTLSIACETAGTGADNIDLGLTPAGTGLVAFSNAASADIAVASTHSARVKFNGTEYKILLATP